MRTWAREGRDRTIEILRGEIVRTMKLLGVISLEELTPDLSGFLNT
jgi:L-lactate dehydrogenase (cytochrome)